MKRIKVVLDSNVIVADWRCTSLAFRLLKVLVSEGLISVAIPSPVMVEVVGSHAREVDALTTQTRRLMRLRRQLNLPAIEDLGEDPIGYRSWLLQLFDEVLGFEVVPWPTVSHMELTDRAVHRRPPFDATGSGYRDALVWATAKEFASDGWTVVLVSTDNDFADRDGCLAPELIAETDGLDGTVDLVRELAPWVMSQLPWKPSDLKEAVADSRDTEFYRFLQQSDWTSELTPATSEMGFPTGTFIAEVHDTVWDGEFVRVDHRTGPDGLLLVEYDIGLDVAVSAEMPEIVAAGLSWGVVGMDGFGRAHLEDNVPMTARILVLFDEYDLFVGVEEVTYWRRDGIGPNDVLGQNPDQLALLDPPD